VVGDGANVAVEARHMDCIARFDAPLVFNCTYAGLNRCVAQSTTLTPIKHEVTEVALVDPPPALASIGVTVMDGPFFSCMPFPAEGCHSLTHVRYTPHGSFVDEDGRQDPDRVLAAARTRSQINYMIADAARFMPCMRSARWRRSLFDIKSVLVRNEADDGRPVLLRRESVHPQLFSVLGGKIDNVYDVLARLESLIERPVAQTAVRCAR